MEAQLKRVSENCQDMWGHNHECVRAEWKCNHALLTAANCPLHLGGHNSLEMQSMMIITDQLLYIAEATSPKIHTRESEVETDGRVRTLVLSLKQYHAHYYWCYEKDTMRVIVGLQGLHTSDSF